MSFVYAINDGFFSILSDTKIEMNDSLSKLWNTESERRLVQQIGLLKSVIVSNNLVICYAGNNIDKAAELLRIAKDGSDNLDELINTALKIHKKAKKDAIEFIIAYCDENNRELISIKNNEVTRNCPLAWLGSYDAFHEFRGLESPNALTECFEDESDQKLQIVLKIEDIFTKVVNSGIDSSVGGMIVKIRYMNGENTFQYMEQFQSISSNWSQVVPFGESIKFCEGAEKGSYSINVYQSSHNYCCYVYEGNFGIVYTDEVIYTDSLEGMKFPKIYKMDKRQFDAIAEQNGAYSCIGLR